MRFHLLGLALMASVAMPAIAQRAEPIDRRVERLEQQLRAVQRRVFPSGNVEPEIAPGSVQGSGFGASGDALSSLSARVDALEAQLRSLTSQVEESNYRTRQFEDQIARLRTDLNGRIERLESAPRAAAEPAPPPRVREQPAAPAEAEAPPAPAPARTADDAEEAYNVGYRLWSAHRYAEAAGALGDAATRFPNSRWASWARNLQGRSYLDDNKPATAARILLANYQDNPRGERAPDSLYYLGQALTRLDRRAEACRVYDELASVYPDMRDTIRSRLPEARTAARCAAPTRN
ncbi:MAG: outer membrane protein assembly factor BamD [Alphaproteobacteria bacterium]|nr:MAG: outer membrane protein assembly factor BamD [Alphaproteobacteria bacterium]